MKSIFLSWFIRSTLPNNPYLYFFFRARHKLIIDHRYSSGTSYTLETIQAITGNTVATNYGAETKKFQHPMTPVFKDEPNGPYWLGDEVNLPSPPSSSNETGSKDDVFVLAKVREANSNGFHSTFLRSTFVLKRLLFNIDWLLIILFFFLSFLFVDPLRRILLWMFVEANGKNIHRELP